MHELAAEQAKQSALELFQKAGIVLTKEERESIEIADCGLDDFQRTGISILTYINNELYCAKEMALLPGQTCPEHAHRPLDNGYRGKQETFRCRYGIVCLHVEGDATAGAQAAPPAGDEAWYTARREIVLRPGEQFTILPDTLHWFQAGPEGAVVSEFSTSSHDEYDRFTDPRIVRVPAAAGSPA